MRPAFASTWQAAAFGFLLLVLLLLPALLTKSFLPPREETYGWTGWQSSSPYHHREIFEEKGDIDIAFIGSSHITCGIDALDVQDKLTTMLGRQSTVRTLGWSSAGFDKLYFLTKDLLQNRRVKMIVFYDECRPDGTPHSTAPNWFRFSDDAEALADLPLYLKLAYYHAAIIGAPKNLICLLRSNLPVDMRPAKLKKITKDVYGAYKIMNQLGSIRLYYGYRRDEASKRAPFEEYVPQNKTKPSDVVIYSSSTKANFEFADHTIPDGQLHFARKFAALSKQYGVKLIFLHLPVPNEARSSNVIHEHEFWPNALQADITMIGIPPSAFFEGLSDQDIHKLFADEDHLNRNGQVYFTQLIIPTLLQLYATQTKN